MSDDNDNDNDKDMEHLEVQGEAGAGMVKVWLSGALRVKRVHVDAEALQNQALLEELIAVALNDALAKLQREGSSQLQKSLRGKLPPELRGLFDKLGF